MGYVERGGVGMGSVGGGGVGLGTVGWGGVGASEARGGVVVCVIWGGVC